MPNYDYKCKKCGKIHNKFHGILETKEYFCDSCKTQLFKMIPKNVSIQFKGSGFYSTDG